MKLFDIKLTSNAAPNFNMIETNLISQYKQHGYTTEMLETFDKILHEIQVMKAMGKLKQAVKLEAKFEQMHLAMAGGYYGTLINDSPEDDAPEVVEEPTEEESLKPAAIITKDGNGIEIKEVIYNGSVITIRDTPLYREEGNGY
jgi:hypothetical protein